VSDGDERRAFERVPVELVVDYADDDDLIVDFTTNLSIGGTFILTEREDLQNGAKVELTLSFPGLIQPLRVAGVVRWCQHKGGNTRGVGIEFLNREKEFISRVAEQLAAIKSHDTSMVARPVRVLLMEDNKHVAALIQQGLDVLSKQSAKPLLFLFHTAVNGQDGRDLMGEFSPDLMIVDLQLPILDGLSVISQTRLEGNQTPIVAISGEGDESRESALRAGANMYFPKPIRLRDLGTAVDSLITLPKPARPHAD